MVASECRKEPSTCMSSPSRANDQVDGVGAAANAYGRGAGKNHMMCVMCVWCHSFSAKGGVFQGHEGFRQIWISTATAVKSPRQKQLSFSLVVSKSKFKNSSVFAQARIPSATAGDKPLNPPLTPWRGSILMLL